MDWWHALLIAVVFRNTLVLYRYARRIDQLEQAARYRL